MIDKSLLDTLNMSREWQKQVDLVNSFRPSSQLFDNPAILLARSLSSMLSKNTLADSLKSFRESYPSPLVNWLPEPKTIKGNPLLWDMMTDVLPKQFSLADSIKQALHSIPVTDPLRAIQSSLFGLSGKISSEAFRKADTTWLPTFEQVNQHAKDLVDDRLTHAPVTKEDMAKLETFLTESFTAVQEEIKKGGKSPMAIIGFIATIISLLLSLTPLLMDYYKAPAQQNTTKQDIEVVRQAILSKYDTVLGQLLKKNTVRIHCALRINPSQHSKVIQPLHEGAQVTVINTNHKWANVTFIDDDNWPITGWVLKKYLVRPAKK